MRSSVFADTRFTLYGGRAALATFAANDHPGVRKPCSPASHLAAILLGSAIGPAAAQIRIGLMVSATGPTSAIGIPQKNTGEILPRTIGGATVEYISLEDGGDTTRARAERQEAHSGEQHRRADRPVDDARTRSRSSTSSPMRRCR